ncbi:hypothetical protein [Methylobacterium sp. J-076]|uniref:hypothetical protein n=1 Tax=Methylobacterium sp. J-076 TaxID=2836655 RepID=UPI001FB864DF|nr:hypothetical protein [Methylobacterium sp. J-076]MCJ2013659.1 hypothetical protein [Methylobacterium sp. J-076]
MADQDSQGPDEWRQSGYLLKIAAALGCTVEEFGSRGVAGARSDELELLRLWSLLLDEAARQHLLDVARALVPQCEPA